MVVGIAASGWLGEWKGKQWGWSQTSFLITKLSSLQCLGFPPTLSYQAIKEQQVADRKTSQGPNPSRAFGLGGKRGGEREGGSLPTVSCELLQTLQQRHPRSADKA